MQYRDGQVYLAQASTIVDGHGTNFAEFCKAGDRLFIRDESVSYVIEEVIAADKLRLTAPYRNTSKITSYSVQLDYSAHFRLMMPYLGDFNVEDMLRLNIGKLDAMMHAACGGVTSNPYTLEIVSLLTNSRQAYVVKINTSHQQPVRITVKLDGVTKVDNQPITEANGVYTGSFSGLTAGDHALDVEVRDNKGNIKSRSGSITVDGSAGGGVTATTPNAGAWVFTPSVEVGGAVTSTENNVIVAMELIDANGVVDGFFSAQKSALAVPTGQVLATGQFSAYPVKIKVWNLSRQEVWRWDSAGVGAVLDSGGALNVGGGAFTATAVPPTPVQDGDTFNTGWSVIANESGVAMDAELYYWGDWVVWYKSHLNLSQTTPSLSAALHDGKFPAAAFPVKYRFKNSAKTVTITYADTTTAATIDTQDHAGSAVPDAIASIDSVTQIAGTQNARVVFKVASNHLSLATEWRIEVDGAGVTAWVAVAFNQVSTVTHTLTNLGVGARNIIVRGRGASVTDNHKTKMLTVVDNAVVIAAPVLANFVITPGQGSATFALDVSDTRPVTYAIFRDGVEIFREATAAVLAAISKTVNVPAGTASFYISVSNDANLQTSTAHTSATVQAADAGAATITQPVAQTHIDAVDGSQSVEISADVDVPDGSLGIHYRFYRYLTGTAPPAADDLTLRGGFEWVLHPADFAPVTVTGGFPHDVQNYTYAIDAKPQGATAFTTASVDVVGQAGAGTGTMNIIINSTSTVAATSYTIVATVSNSASEAQEYRILENGVEKVGWVALASNGQFTQTLPATAGAYAVVIEAKTASIAVASQGVTINVNAAANAGTVGVVSPGSNTTQGNLKITLSAMNWTVDPVYVEYRPEIITPAAGLVIWAATKQAWTTNYGTYYEKANGLLRSEEFTGLQSGDMIKVRFELRDAGGVVMDAIETAELTKP